MHWTDQNIEFVPLDQLVDTVCGLGPVGIAIDRGEFHFAPAPLVALLGHIPPKPFPLAVHNES